MKTLPPAPRVGARERGFASVLVLALLLVLVAMVMANVRVVSAMRQELRILEVRQLQKYAGAGTTNAPPATPAQPDRSGEGTR